MLPVVLAVLAAVLVLTAAVLVPVLLADDEAERAGPVDLSEVTEHDDLSNAHLRIGEGFDYPQSPPVGGEHAPMWLECGVYDEPVPEVYAVHDLEHGTVWITYRPEDLERKEVDALAGLLPDNGIMSPYPDQDAPVVITVWGRQLALTGADDPRIRLFLDAYGAGETAPEPFASCHGGADPAELPEPGQPGKPGQPGSPDGGLNV
ncbi:DUF3105 domain-containing protein [Nocardioides sp. zg-536]|uniref:DUF3105 domain-containing protein n=1 Tax=Nocardioides faecalis TaxID=2803858 RepID=A0A939BTE9_9ACTN|nr:DUF3105 domain-containing protein [Nocardioides faecalis]MBM9460584.1 DUF3105 domain-containing protein [Nocardioides faecalis]MBS4754353.1 DUF3105 domain-containing protein [Nocardioides faecalis]QVI57490.1 DUF3105 domain-containing protein [Nocardioides faecalis]